MSDNLIVRKTIRLNNQQVENWNPENVRHFLNDNLLEKLYNLMVNAMKPKRILNQEEIETIKKIGEILNLE